MKTLKIKQTSKSGVIANLNGAYGQITNGKFVPYTKEELANKTAYAVNYGWVDYKSLDEYLEERRIFNEKRQAEKEAKRTLIQDVQNNPEKYTALQIYTAAVDLNRQPLAGWQGADLLMTDSPFSRAILSKAKTYTVTPFDDGSLLIKIDGIKYGNKRGWGNINDFLAD